MSASNNEVNADGLVQHYGRRVSENAVGSQTESEGFVKEYVVDFDFNSVNASAAGTVLGVPTADILVRQDMASIPLGSIIVDITLMTETAFVGDTIEVNYVSSAKVADASEAVGGSVSAGGAAIGQVAGGAFTAPSAAIGYVDVVETTAAGTGALTAGAGRVVVRYI